MLENQRREKKENDSHVFVDKQIAKNDRGRQLFGRPWLLAP